MPAKIELKKGDRFGRLTVVEPCENLNGRTAWKCTCCCDGKEVKIMTKYLLNGNTKSCGCLSKENLSKFKKEFVDDKIKDWAEKKYYSLTFIKIAEKSKDGMIWEAKCDCGKSTKVIPRFVVSGNTKTCGKCNSKYLIDDYKEIAEEWDYEKNLNYNINEITHASSKKVWWICKECGHSYLSMVSNRCFHFSGCPECNESKGERITKEKLNRHNIEFEREKKFLDCRDKRCLFFDFYLPAYSTCIEFDGIQHYNINGLWTISPNRFEDIQRKDRIKDKYCQDNNIKLIRIPYWDLKNIEEILTRELKLCKN